MKRLIFNLKTFAGAMILVACSGTSAFAQTNVFDDIIVPSANHTYLEQAILQEGLEGSLQDPNANLTVFAPDDAAFDALATALNTDINGLLALPNLTDILLYHVLGTTVNSGAMNNGDITQPLSPTNTLKLTVTGSSQVFVNQAQVTGADNNADNGTVHIVDAIVLPSETVVDVAIDNGFTSLTTAVIQEELVPVLTDPLASFTVFAPTDQAFNDLATALNTDINGLLALPNLSDVLTYHVLGTEVASNAIANGDIVQPVSPTNTLKLTVTGTNDVFVNQAQVTMADVMADNGTVHALDAVVLPGETVVDVAIDNGFSSLTTAVIQEELVPVLTDPLASFTVFAPTDQAFDDLATALNTDINGLLALPNLADILTYHVLGSEVTSGAITNGDIVQPVSATNTLKLTVTGNSEVFVNQAQVTLADVMADNGTVHALDAVVLPSETVVDVAIDNGFTTLTTALIQEELLPALTDPLASFTVFAPTDQAFDDLAAELNTDINGLLALPNLTDILLYHVVDGAVLSGDLTAGTVATLNGESVLVDLSNGVMINDATVTMADVTSDNGVVHIIDGVLDPSTASLGENETIELTVYPNPTSDVFKVDGKNIVFMNLIGMDGSLLKTVNGSSMDVTTVPSGNYLLEVQTENGSFTEAVNVHSK